MLGLVALMVSPTTPATSGLLAPGHDDAGAALRFPVAAAAPASRAVLEGVIGATHRAQGNRPMLLLLVAVLAALGADLFRRPLRRFGHRSSRIVCVTLWTFRGRAPPAS